MYISSLSLLVPGIHPISGITRVMYLYSLPEQHSAACRGQALRYPGQAGVKGDGAQSRFPCQGTLAKGWTGTTKVAVKHPWLHSIKSYINA